MNAGEYPREVRVRIAKLFIDAGYTPRWKCDGVQFTSDIDDETLKKAEKILYDSYQETLKLLMTF